MKKKDRVPYILFSVFAIIGMILIIAGIVILMSSVRFKPSSVDITAVISDSSAKVATNSGIVFVCAMFCGMGLIFALIGIIPLIIMARKKVQSKKLMENGQYIYGVVENIQLNTGYSVNGTHPYVIYCTYKDEYKDIVYRFKSDNIWTNPEYVIQPGSDIRIYVDRTDYRKYHVDTESILNGRIVDYT